MLQQSQVDGYIISPPVNSEDQIRSLARGIIPFVLIDRYFPEIDCNYIVVDNFDAAYKATNHLLALGRKRIANITVNLNLINMKERAEGYLQALRDESVDVAENLLKELPFSHDNKDVARDIKELLGKTGNQKVDAILFSTSKLGINGIESISALGLKIPDDIAVVSFDNPDAYKICASPVTVVNQPLNEIGKTVVQVLIGQIKHPENIFIKQKITLKTNIIIRKSCGS